MKNDKNFAMPVPGYHKIKAGQESISYEILHQYFYLQKSAKVFKFFELTLEQQFQNFHHHVVGVYLTLGNSVAATVTT